MLWLPASAGSHDTRKFEIRGFGAAPGARFAVAQGGKRRAPPRRSRTPCARDRRSTRRLGIERVQLAAGDRSGLSSGAQIVWLNVGADRREVDAPPLPPSALVAAVRLLVCEPLSQRFEETAEPGRK